MNSNEIINQSKYYMPGGVNSPVRAFNGMDIEPPVIKSGKGAKIYDEDGKEYIDFVLSWGPLILGHCNQRVNNAITESISKGLSFGAPTKVELDMAKFIEENIEFVDMVRMVNSGTEATMSAIKLARGYTKRNKIIKFAGCYHGHFDGFLVEAGSGVLTSGIPGSLGIPSESIQNTLIGEYNNLKQVENLFQLYGNDIAGVIIEPVAGNMGVIKARDEFINGIRKLCDEYKALLIFDEVMSGFRAAFKGATSLFEVKPDIVTYAKIIGGGLPAGAYCGKREIMEKLAPLGGVYQAGTMSGNPIVMSAGLETLKILKENPGIYEKINMLGEKLEDGVKQIAKAKGIQLVINRVGGMLTIFFTDLEKVETYEDVKKCDNNMFKKYFQHMLKEGIYLPPSQFEAMFLSCEHTEEDIDTFLNAFKRI